MFFRRKGVEARNKVKTGRSNAEKRK